MDSRLYHISDKQGIKRFEPRPAPSKSAKQEGEMVWAVDYEHLHNYLLPRNCPRVTFFALKESDPKDIKKMIGETSFKHVVAIESIWFPKVKKHVIYQYEFDPQGFELVDKIAGYWISRQPVVPIAETKIDNILTTLSQHDVYLRIMPSLWELREEVIHSTLGYSIIRMNHAQPPADGYDLYHPLP